jgi:hypothetical protein
MSLVDLCGCLQCLILLVAVVKGALWVIGLLLVAAEERRAAELAAREERLRGLWDESDRLPGRAVAGADGLRGRARGRAVVEQPEPLTVEDLYRLASEGLDERLAKLPSDGEGKIR